MPQLKCIVDHLPYGGVVYRMGDRFFASDEDARLLKGFEKAADAAPTSQSKEMEPGEHEVGASPEPSTKPRRNRYRRTDMRSED